MRVWAELKVALGRSVARFSTAITLSPYLIYLAIADRVV